MIATLRSVRSAFVALLFALTLYALAESAFAGAGTASEVARAEEGLSACGTADNPCQLEALTVEAEPSSSATRLVVSEHAPKMKLRVKS